MTVDRKISELARATSVNEDDLLPLVQSGATKAVEVQNLLGGAVSVKWFGAVGDGVTNDSAAIQAAIDGGSDIDFVGGTYACNNLTQDDNLQVFRSTGGIARLVKNANGALFTASGDNVQFHDINFRGDASSPTYTGDGFVSSGAHTALYNCGARWFSGRAAKMTGSHAQIYGTCDIYQTTDATGTGYDIEIGVSGTATLYHQLHGIYTSQATGGILLVDTGSHAIVGGQFGKLTIDSGTSPAGVNGGMTLGARILGATVVEISSATFAGNQFGAVSVTFATGTSGIKLDTSNVFQAGATVTNSGNANNLIIREVSGGSVNQLKFGDDTSSAILEINPSGHFEFPADVRLKNSSGHLVFEQAGGTDGMTASVSAGGNWAMSNAVAAAIMQYIQAGAGSHRFTVNSVERLRVDSSATATHTNLLLYDVDNATLERVTVGAADTGGSGFKVLRIPN